MAVISALIIIANKGLGLDLPEEAILAIAGVVMAYIFGQGAVDAIKELKK